MRIEILNAEIAEIEPLKKAIERAATRFTLSNHIQIHCQIRGQRNFPQWLEYTICVFKEEEDKAPYFVMGMIQRTLDAEFEFHS